MLVVTFTYHENDIRHPITTTVNLNLPTGSLQLYQLVGSQMVGKGTERQAVDRDIEVGLIFSRQLALHLADGIVREHTMHRHLIILSLENTKEKQTSYNKT